jgi:hypothetical protein
MGNINTKGPKMKAKREKGMRSRNYHLAGGAKKIGKGKGAIWFSDRYNRTTAEKKTLPYRV